MATLDSPGILSRPVKHGTYVENPVCDICHKPLSHDWLDGDYTLLLCGNPSCSDTYFSRGFQQDSAYQQTDSYGKLLKPDRTSGPIAGYELKKDSFYIIVAKNADREQLQTITEQIGDIPCCVCNMDIDIKKLSREEAKKLRDIIDEELLKPNSDKSLSRYDRLLNQ